MSKIAVVTGASSGLGLPMTGMLAAKGYDLVVLNRSKASFEACAAAAKDARRDAKVTLIQADLSVHSSIRRAAEELNANHPAIDLLINNAGVLTDAKTMSAQGLEMHFQVNAVTPYLLMRLLRPALARATQGRVLNVGSSAMFLPPVGPLKVSELSNPPRMRKLVGAYAQSKLALAILSSIYAKDLQADGTIVRVGEPGPNKTAMTAGSGMPGILLLLKPLIFSEPSVGAKRLITAALDPKFGAKTGIYVEAGKIKALPRGADDPKLASDLMMLLNRCVNL